MHTVRSFFRVFLETELWDAYRSHQFTSRLVSPIVSLTTVSHISAWYKARLRRILIRQVFQGTLPQCGWFVSRFLWSWEFQHFYYYVKLTIFHFPLPGLLRVPCSLIFSHSFTFSWHSLHVSFQVYTNCPAFPDSVDSHTLGTKRENLVPSPPQVKGPENVTVVDLASRWTWTGVVLKYPSVPQANHLSEVATK